MDEQIEHAVAIGRENQNLISLGKAWCTHIRADRSGWGVGMVEQATGLPITGGRFTCDFARQPSQFAGMQLAVTALEFYEDNCKGCPHHAPGGRVPNLSTWAEPLLAERDEWKKAQAAAQQAAEVERQKRTELRTLVAASLPATSQEIVGLVNRIDLDPYDADADDSIRDLAHLAPDAFTDDIKEMLRTDARLLQSAVLLDVLLEVNTSGAQLHELCLEAVRKGWGIAEGCRYLSEHGLQADLDQDLLDAIVFHTTPTDTPMHAVTFRTPGEPAALLRYHSQAPDVVEQRVCELLRHGDAWRRAAAASASEALVATDPGCGRRLLTALLDGLRHREDWDGHDQSSDTIASVAAVLLKLDAQFVDAVVERRWGRASAECRARLIGCYDAVARPALEQFSAEVGRILIARAVTALSEPLDRDSDSIYGGYQGRASDLLEMAVQVAPTDVLQPNVLIGLLLDWLERARNLSETELAETDPTNPLAALEKMSAQARIDRILRGISDAVVALGRRDSSEFIAVCSEIYSGTESAPSARAEIVRIAGQVAAAPATVTEALPLVYSAMLGDDQVVRAAGMEAAERVMRAIPCESIPPLLAQAVVTGLTDQYLIVGMAAVKAMREVPADLIDHHVASVRLLVAAASYASDRLRDRMVQDALVAVHHLAQDDEHLLSSTREIALEVVKRMPAHNARETLCRHRWLESHNNWTDVAIHALRLDDNPQYENLGNDDKESLLEKLGRRRLAAHQIEALVTGELTAGKLNWRRSLLAAELFSELGRPDLSVRMIGAHLESVPDTIERQPTRRSMEKMMLTYSLEEVIASRHDDARRQILYRIEELCAEE